MLILNMLHCLALMPCCLLQNGKSSRLDFDEMARRLKNKIIFDGRNQYNREKLNELGFEYFQIGVGE